MHGVQPYSRIQRRRSTHMRCSAGAVQVHRRLVLPMHASRYIVVAQHDAAPHAACAKLCPCMYSAWCAMLMRLVPLYTTMMHAGSRCDTRQSMLVKPDAYETLYETFLREQASTLERNVVIFAATTSCDAVCATKILMVLGLGFAYLQNTKTQPIRPSSNTMGCPTRSSPCATLQT